jgi:hypothetical protein
MSIVAARAAVAAVGNIPGRRGMEPQFMLLEITREAPNQATGTVVSQTPPPGGRVKEPASIEVIVAK